MGRGASTPSLLDLLLVKKQVDQKSRCAHLRLDLFEFLWCSGLVGGNKALAILSIIFRSHLGLRLLQYFVSTLLGCFIIVTYSYNFIYTNHFSKAQKLFFRIWGWVCLSGQPRSNRTISLESGVLLQGLEKRPQDDLSLSLSIIIVSTQLARIVLVSYTYFRNLPSVITYIVSTLL